MVIGIIVLLTLKQEVELVLHLQTITFLQTFKQNNPPPPFYFKEEFLRPKSMNGLYSFQPLNQTFVARDPTPLNSSVYVVKMLMTEQHTTL